MIKKSVLQKVIIGVCLLLSSCSDSTIQQLKLMDGAYELMINTANMKLQFAGKTIVPGDTLSGLFINEEPIISSEILKESRERVYLLATSNSGEKATVDITFKDGISKVCVEPVKDGICQVSLRFGGMLLAHGLGDAGGWNNSFDLAGDKEKKFEIVNDGGRKRWLSTFTIFPKNNFAGVFFDRGKKSVVLSENTYQMNTEIEGASTFYLFVGKPKEIYANYKKVRNEVGYEDTKPKARLFELGWESWDALGWNTNQFTVKEILAKFQEEGYPIRWAVTGSGFWDEGGTTTSFGRFGEKFPDAEEFKNWMHKNDIYWMIGQRTNFVPSGGPYFPVTDKRDKNLKVRSFYGNELSDEALKNDLFLSDAENNPRLLTSRIFPIVPCYLLDGNKPGAADWFLKTYRKWKVDGIKEDTMMDLEDETSIFNKPIARIANEGGHVMARCGEFSAPGTLLRINDTNVNAMQNRTPVNYLQFAASGAPNVYSDVAGVHNMHNVKAIDANIRHAWLLSLTAGMAVGAFPSKWAEEEQKIFKKAVDFHYSLVPYLYSASMASFETGYPYTMTPMSIAFPEDEQGDVESFQWMIGESVLATPLLRNYKEGKKDIYLPEGTWFDWKTGEKFTGPQVLKGYSIPLNKTPCFVGGNGVVILRKPNSKEVIARVYPMGKKVSSVFYALEDKGKYCIESELYSLENVSVVKVSSDEDVNCSKLDDYLEFHVTEGAHYKVNQASYWQ